MNMFTLEDPVGMVKRFDVGEYKGNKLPMIMTKVKNTINPVNKKEGASFTVKVEKDGKLLDVLDLSFNELFNEGESN